MPFDDTDLLSPDLRPTRVVPEILGIIQKLSDTNRTGQRPIGLCP
jgi:hypothetical protein